MDLTNKSQLINYLQSHGLYTKKSLGQNFLVDSEALNKIVAAAELSKDDCVIEVGPGLGVMTEELVEQAGRVVAVELDRKLAELLAERLISSSDKTYSAIPSFHSVIPAEAGILPADGSPGHGWSLPRTTIRGLPEDDKQRGDWDDKIGELEIINSNILDVNIAELTKDYPTYKVVANIPYYITSKIIRFFLEQEKKPETIVLLTQKEVAERICAIPGDMSILSVSVQYYGQPEIVGVVPRTSFFPAPEVNSAILRISNIKPSSTCHSDRPEGVEESFDSLMIDCSERSLGFARDDRKKREGEGRKGSDDRDKECDKLFFQCVKIGFASRRKTLLNNLSAGYHLDKNQVLDILISVDLNDKTRAQELSVEKWEELCQKICEKG